MSQSIDYTVDTLDCGARLIIAPLAARQSVSVSFAFAVGSRYESEDDAGLSHFIEHMVFKGTERFPTSGVVSEAIEGVGGVLNAVTDREETVFWARVPRDHLARAAGVLAEMMRRPRLDNAEVVKERGVVVEELRMYADNPQDHVQTLFDDVMWPDHALGRDVAGSERTVNSFTRDDCARHLDTYYRPERAVITVSGAVDPEHCRGVIDEVLGDWAAGGAAGSPVPAADISGSRVRHDARKIEQTNIVVGVRGPSYNDEERHAVDILNVILGEGMSSRLFLEIRENQGLAYDVHSFTTRLADTGAVGIGIGCEPSRAVDATRSALAELHKLADDAVSDAELDKAKAYATGRMSLHLESTSGLGGFLSQQLLLTGRILKPDEIIELLAAVTTDEVREAARTLCSRDMRASVVGPVLDRSAFEEVISAAASSGVKT